MVEARTSFSVQAALQSAIMPEIGAAIEEAHRQSIRAEMLKQIVNGDGAGNNLSGILDRANIGSATYPQSDRGKAEAFLTAEAAVEDADGAP